MTLGEGVGGSVEWVWGLKPEGSMCLCLCSKLSDKYIHIKKEEIKSNEQ